MSTKLSKLSEPFDRTSYTAIIDGYDDPQVVVDHIKKMVPELKAVVYVPPSGPLDIVGHDDSFIQATFIGDYYDARSIEKKMRRLARGEPKFTIEENQYSIDNRRKELLYDLYLACQQDSS